MINILQHAVHVRYFTAKIAVKEYQYPIVALIRKVIDSDDYEGIDARKLQAE